MIREEVDRIRNDGISEQELTEAQTAYLQAARVRRTKDNALAGELLSTIFNGRTMQHHADHIDNINAATVESVNNAIKKHIDPEKLVISIAGDWKK